MRRTAKRDERASFWDGPFRWLVLAHGLSGLAFWGSFGTIFAQATFAFHAGTTQLAVLGATLSLPLILGSLLQGLAVDRWSPKWLSAIGYVIMLAAIPFAWTASSMVGLYVSTFMIGGAFATIEPSRSALTGLLVAPDHLVRANGVIAISFQLSIVLGTLGGGALLQLASAGAVFATACAISLAPPILLLAVPDVRQRGEQPAFTFTHLRAGAASTWRHPQLRILLLVTALGWTLVNVFFVLEPLFVKQTLHRSGDSLLYLWAAHGLGAVAGAVAVTRIRRATGREAEIVCAGVALVGTGILIYAGVGLYGASLAGAALSGMGFAFLFPPLLALIQRVVSEDQRGRVTGLFLGLQETMGLASSIALLVLGGVVVVRPTLVSAGVVLGAIGIFGLRALQRLPASLDESPG